MLVLVSPLTWCRVVSAGVGVGAASDLVPGWCRQVSVLVLLPAVVLTAAVRSLHQGPLLLHGSLMAALLLRCVMVIVTAVELNLAHLTGVSGRGGRQAGTRGRQEGGDARETGRQAGRDVREACDEISINSLISNN